MFGATVASFVQTHGEHFQLVAGREGIDNEFSSILVADQEIPSSYKNQFVILGDQLVRRAYGNRQLQKIFKNFHQKEASVLCLHQADRMLDHQLMDWADHARLPILSASPSISWDQCCRLIYHFLLRQGNRVFESHTQLESFLDHVMKTTDPYVILNHLHGFLRRPLFYYDRRLQLKHAIEADDLPSSIGDAILNYLLQQRGIFQIENNRVNVRLTSEHHMAIKPVHSSTECLGYLIVVYPPEEADIIDWVAVHHAATALSLQTLHQFYVEQQQEHIRHGFVYDLLFGRYHSSAVIEPRAVELGFNFTTPHRVILLQVRRAYHNKYAALLTSVADQLSDRLHVPLLHTSFGQGLILLLPVQVDAGKFVKKLVEEAAKQFPSEPVRFVCGISAQAELPSDYPAALDQAIQSINIGSHVCPGETIYSYESLGVYRLFSELSSKEKHLLEGFSHRVLAEIKDRHELYETLQSYFSSGGSTEKAAESLYVHGNTVRYRLRKIEQLTGMSLGDPEDAFMLQLALKLHQFLQIPT